MTIHESTLPYHATLTRLPGGTVGLLTVAHTASTPAAAVANLKRRTLFNVIFDNSASMGTMTFLGLEKLLRPMIKKQWFTSTVVTLFDENAKSWAIPDETAFNTFIAALPPQQNTNITAGVSHGMQQAASFAASCPGDEDVHVLTMLLTDGQHNRGPKVSVANTEAMRAKLLQARGSDKAPVHHTVLIFCLTNNSDANASMIVKEVFETAKMPGLPNVFYAKDESEMSDLLENVVDTCGSLFDANRQGGNFVSLTLSPSAQFIASGTPVATHYFTPMHTETFVVTLAAESNWITVNDEQLPVVEIPLGHDAIAAALAAVKDALQPLTRQAVAFDAQAIERRLVSLETLVGAIDEVAAASRAEAGTRHRTPVERRAALKRIVSTQYGLHEIRNQLAALRVRSRSNSDSISLLTGNKRKFAHIASRRSGTESRTPQAVAQNTAAVGAALRDLIREDAAVTCFVDTELPVTSVSLQTNAELLEQWAEPCGDDLLWSTAAQANANDEGIMDVLSTYGLAGFPVQLVTCDATQVDFSQLSVREICPQLADSASMMMSWRLNLPIKCADGNSYTELLLLVDPAMPRATTHVLSQSMLVQHLLSAMISKDLYMYLPPMHSAMHTHCFAAAVSKAITLGSNGGGGGGPVGSFVRLALQIVYSARKLLESKVIFEDTMWSFTRWLTELKSITRAPADDVHHVTTLSMKLAISAFDVDRVDDRAAVLLQLNEHLARALTAVTHTFVCPAAFAQALFRITAEDAPQVTADSEENRDEATVRQTCRKHIANDMLDGASDVVAQYLRGHATVRAFVEAEWLGLFRLHQFSTALHAVLRRRGITMDTFCAVVERAAEIPTWLVDEVQEGVAAAGTDAAAMWAFLGVDEADVRAVCAAAVMQASLYPGTQERSGVVHELDVTDPTVQRGMIEELYMLHYRVACSLKGSRRYAVVGEVTAMQAASAEVAALQQLIGTHTHGHCRRVFWGILRGLLSDTNDARRQAKLDEFKQRSSQPGFDAVLKRARRGGRS